MKYKKIIACILLVALVVLMGCNVPTIAKGIDGFLKVMAPEGRP